MKSFVRKFIAIITICVVTLGFVGCGMMPNITNDSPQTSSAKANGEKPFIPRDINTHLNFAADYGEDVNLPEYKFVYSMKFDGTVKYDAQSCGHVIGQIVEHYTGLSGEDVFNKLNKDKTEDGDVLMWMEHKNVKVVITIAKDGTTKAGIFIS
jgi:hypothetical protein